MSEPKKLIDDIKKIIPKSWLEPEYTDPNKIPESWRCERCGQLNGWFWLYQEEGDLLPNQWKKKRCICVLIREAEFWKRNLEAQRESLLKNDKVEKLEEKLESLNKKIGLWAEKLKRLKNWLFLHTHDDEFPGEQIPEFYIEGLNNFDNSFYFKCMEQADNNKTINQKEKCVINENKRIIDDFKGGE